MLFRLSKTGSGCLSNQVTYMARLVIGGVLWVALCLILGMQAVYAAQGQFIVKLKNAVELSANPSVRRLEHDAEAIAAVMQRNGVDATLVRAGAMGVQIMQWGAKVRDSDREPLLNRLRSDPEVEFAQEDVQVRVFSTPSDTSFASQWALKSVANTGGAKFDKAWDLIRGSSGVVVAVLDTGVVFETPELAGRLLAGYDFVSNASIANDGDGRDASPADPGNWISTADAQTSAFSGCQVRDSSWHGTFVAGQIAANTNNGSGVAGADWNVRILPVRVMGKCGGSLSDVLDGMLWSAGISVPGVSDNKNPASVINLSLGSSTTCSSYEQTVIDRVTTAGALVVAAAGNGAGAVESPASCNNVMAVGALDKDGSRAAYSALGSGLDLMAPGGYYNGLVGVGNTGTTSPGSATLVNKTGTSFASPLVAAAAGLLKAVNPALTPAALSNLLTQNAAPFLSPTSKMCTVNSGSLTCNCSTSVCGAGMLDVFAAVQAARGTLPLSNPVASNQTVSSSGYQASASGSSVVLDGSASSVASGNTIAAYAWEQVSGASVLTGTSNSATLNLTAPTSTSDLLFRLTVTDSVGQSHASYASVRVVASGDSGTAPIGSSGLTTGSSGGTGSASTSSSDTSGGSSGGSGGGGGGGSLGFYGVAGLFWVLRSLRSSKSRAA